MSNNGCEGCYYYKPLFRKPFAEKCCHYMLIEDEQRGCPPGKDCSRRLELDEEATTIKDRKDRKYINDAYNWRLHR